MGAHVPPRKIHQGFALAQNFSAPKLTSRFRRPLFFRYSGFYATIALSDCCFFATAKKVLISQKDNKKADYLR
jgi:hypothetical protein